MFAKQMEGVQKWVNKDRKGKEGSDGRTGLAEDEEGIQEVAQRKPTLGRGRMSSTHSWGLVVSSSMTPAYP